MKWMNTEASLKSIGLGLVLCLSVLDAGAGAKDPMAVAFGTMPALWNVQISPDGSKIVFLQMHAEDLPIAVVFDFASGTAKMVLASEKDRFDLSWCSWANDERILCGYSAVHRKAHLLFPVTRLVAVNADGSDLRVLMQRKPISCSF
jgi:hypothetical protein